MEQKKNSGFYMLLVACQRACLAVLAALLPASVGAQYQLKLDSPAQFRLASPESQAPVPAESRDTPGSARLAKFPYSAQIERAAKLAALDPALIHAVIHVESRHNPAARSPKGALGLMQVMPETASRYGIRDAARTIEANLTAGTSYLRDLMNMFDGRIELALAAYNAGENAVFRHGLRIPPYRETQHYVPAVLEKYGEWRDPPLTEPPQGPRRIVYMPGTTLESAARPGQMN